MASCLILINFIQKIAFDWIATAVKTGALVLNLTLKKKAKVFFIL